jgi:uncharacterized phage-associated protein
VVFSFLGNTAFEMSRNLASPFDERRTAQAAAFLLHRADAPMQLIKLIKLLYLAERLSLQRYGEPITGDKLVSMDHGPVLSRTYNHIVGSVPSMEGGWETWITDKSNHEVALRNKNMVRSPEEDLLRLSDSDLEVLDEIWRTFGSWEAFALVDYTHSGACPEWEDPDGSSKPIQYETLFKALGYTAAQSQALTERLSAQRQLNDTLLAS